MIISYEISRKTETAYKMGSLTDSFALFAAGNVDAVFGGGLQQGIVE